MLRESENKEKSGIMASGKLYRTIQLTAADFRHVTDEPVDPIEKSSSWCAGMRSHSRHEGLNKAQNCSGQADRGVYRRGAPCAQLHEYYDEGRDRHRPGEHHEEPVPLGRGGKIDRISLQRKEREKGAEGGSRFPFRAIRTLMMCTLSVGELTRVSAFR